MWQKRKILDAQERQEIREKLETLRRLLDQETDPESVKDLEARITRLKGELDRFSLPDEAFRA